MNQIDITIKKVCVYCKTELSFHHPYDVGLTTMSEHTTVTLRIYDTFVNCPNCGEPFFLRIQAQPKALDSSLISHDHTWLEFRLGKVQMHVTVPHHQQGPALSS